MVDQSNWVIEPINCENCPFCHFDINTEYEYWCSIDPVWVAKNVLPSIIPTPRSIPKNCPLRDYTVTVRLVKPCTGN